MSQALLKTYLGAAGRPGNALPGSWYSSPEMYELERRAIFSRRWMLLTHSSRIPDRGDWLRYDVADIEFILCRDRDGSVNAFHNVCRHRAFPVLPPEKGDKGNSSFFACKYHGWSYGLNGKLAKAPGYQDLPGFDKSKNGLLPIHVHVDEKGLVWVNFDAGEKPAIPWGSEGFETAFVDTKHGGYDWGHYAFDHTFDLETDCNWKIALDNFHESYHGHNVDVSPSVLAKGATMRYLGRATPDKTDSSAFFFPNASMSITPNYYFIQRVVPTSQGKTTIRVEVFRNKFANDAAFGTVKDVEARLASENLGSQRAIPELGDATLHVQSQVRESLQSHFQKEVQAGNEIWPARQNVPETAKESEEDAAFCSAVDCCRKNRTQPIAV